MISAAKIEKDCKNLKRKNLLSPGKAALVIISNQFKILHKLTQFDRFFTLASIFVRIVHYYHSYKWQLPDFE